MRVQLRGSPKEIAEFFRTFTGFGEITTTPKQTEKVKAPAAQQPQSEQPQSEQPPKSEAPPKKTSKPKQGIGFVQPFKLPDEGEEKVEEEKAQASVIERRIMNFLVENENSDIDTIANALDLDKDDAQNRLAQMEKYKWVKSSFQDDNLFFSTLPIRRAFQVPPEGHRRPEIIGDVISQYPGSTNRQIGCRLLTSTEDVAATTGAKSNLDRLWKRTGSGVPDNPFRYYPVDYELNQA